MTKGILSAAVAAGLCLVMAGNGLAASSRNKAQIARGEYLVKALGQCADCHTPRNDHGEFVMEQWLHGAKLDFAMITPIPVWADAAPNIAGLPGWDQEKAIQFFMTGLAPNGQPARPPMPQYKMNRADAEAVVAYLQSLK